MSVQQVAIAGFTLAALAYLFVTVLLWLRRSATTPGRLLTLAVALQAGWAAVVGFALAAPLPPPAVDIAEALRSFGWVAFLAVLPRVARVAPDGNPVVVRASAVALGGAALLALLSVSAAWLALGPTAQFGARTLLAVLGLVVLEQVYRNAGDSQRWALKFLAVALLALFGFDLLMYSDALLFSALDADWFVARGYANALVAPLIAVAAVRNRTWRLDIMVSRQVVFHSAVLVAVGAYLLAMSMGGYYLRYFGGEWGRIAQTLLIFAAAIGLLVILLSGQVRAHLRVLIAKHFFNYRYDYRERWLALTRTLSGSAPDVKPGKTRAPTGNGELATRAVASLGALVESPGGALWLREDGSYVYAGGANHRGTQDPIAADDPLVLFLRRTGWVIELPELARHPARYEGLQLPRELAGAPQGWLIVPLSLEEELLGFVLLRQALAPLRVDWEVRDVLNTAAAQIASYLGLQRAVEQLVQARQFESFNRMSAFVVHDLKNLVAQLGLLTSNAQRHGAKPEFQADVMATVENVRERMQGLLMQLREGTRPIDKPAVTRIAPLLDEAIAAKRAMQPVPALEIDASATSAAVLVHPERLVRVIGHLLQNAIEAAGSAGWVVLRARTVDGEIRLEVQDNGRGMSEDFIRDRLFRAFESTKEHGMGIGTFESREYVRELGGALEVSSREGSGTTFLIRLPLARTESVGAPETSVAGALLAADRTGT